MCLYCQRHKENQKRLRDSIEYLLNYCENNTKVNKLICYILTYLRDSDQISLLIEKILNKIMFLHLDWSSYAEQKKGIWRGKYYAVYQYYRILQCIVSDSHLSFISANQKKILSVFISQPIYLEMIKEHSFKDFFSDLIEHKRRRTPQVEVYIKFYKVFFSLLGSLMCENQVCILQLQKIFIYEQLKNASSHISMPYVFKKPFIRCLFQVKIDFPHEAYFFLSSIFSPSITQSINSSPNMNSLHC